MDTKVLSEKIAKALVFQEKIAALESQVATLKDKAGTNKRDADRLQAVLKANEGIETTLVHIEAELASTQSALATYLNALEDEGINLPLGQKKQVIKGRL